MYTKLLSCSKNLTSKEILLFSDIDRDKDADECPPENCEETLEDLDSEKEASPDEIVDAEPSYATDVNDNYTGVPVELVIEEARNLPSIKRKGILRTQNS